MFKNVPTSDVRGGDDGLREISRVRVRFQRQAFRQIDEALGYVAARSPSGTAKIERRITTILDLLQMQSGIGRRTKMPGEQRFRHTARRPI